jgi:hypothetical protein
MEVLSDKYLFPGLVPMFFGSCLSGGSAVKIPESGFGGGTMIGDLMIAPVGGVKAGAADLTLDHRLKSLLGVIDELHSGTDFRVIQIGQAAYP